MIRHHFRDLPIGRKLTLIALPICATGLLLAFVAVTWLSAVTLRRGTEQQTRSLAAVVAENSAGALSFSDAENAGRTLHGLAATPGIVLACLYQSGEPGSEPGLLATYGPQAASRCPPRPVEQPGRNRLQVLQPVRAGGELIGHLLLERDLCVLRRQTEVTFATSFASFLLALLL
ncbi:MAG: CHASE sensor domain-containing protein, partial [Stagnimonas sp.]|nr:CHASE sensor domain-containing protein [Stagnimonas sp.]